MTYNIKLVNHTGATTQLQSAIQTTLQEFFTKAFLGTSDRTLVQWGTGAAADAIVIHVVDDIASSYIQQQMGGTNIRADAGGHTATAGTSPAPRSTCTRSSAASAA